MIGRRLISGTLAAAAALATPWLWAEPLAKVTVSERGLCGVTCWDLVQAGAEVEGLPLEEVALTNLGDRVASVVQDSDGDGVFDGSDRVIFFGQRLRGEGVHRYRHADENTYLVERLRPDERPLRASRPERLGPAHPLDVEAPVAFHRYTHIEEDRHFCSPFGVSKHFETDFTFNTFLNSLIRKDRTLTFDAPGIDRRSEVRFSLAIELYGRTEAGSEQLGIPDHSILATLNGERLGRVDFDGKGYHLAVFEDLDPRLLRRRGNELRLRLVDRRGLEVDEIFIDWIELLHPTRPFLPADRGEFALPGPSGGRHFEIGGLTSDRVHLLCLTDNSVVPVEVSLEPAGTHSARFAAPCDDGLYAISTESRLLAPDRVERFAPAMPLQPEEGVEHLIVTHPDFRAAADRLAAHRREIEGLQSMVVEVQDLYDLFNHGVPHPEGIRRGLLHVFESWPAPRLRYVVLMGDASWDWHGVEFDESQTFIPTTYHRASGPEYPGDSTFAMENEDAVPKFSVGRLPVKTPEEAAEAVDKLIAYGEEMRAQQGGEIPDWRHRIVFAASDHKRYRDFLERAVETHIEGRFDLMRAYASDASPLDCTEEIISAVNEGVAFLSYVGHGASYVWQTGTTLARSAVDYEANFNPDRVADLHNRRALPIVFGITCFTNNFTNPNPRNCIGEKLVLSPQGGAVASIATASYSFIHSDLVMCEALFEALFEDEPERVGDLYLAAVAKSKVSRDSRLMFIILGDPAAPLPLVPLPEEEWRVAGAAPGE